MKKFAIIAAVTVAAAVPATAGAKQFSVAGNQKPTDGIVCQPHGINAKAGWAIQFDDDGVATKIVRLNRSGAARLAKGVCIEYVAGKPVRLTTSVAYTHEPTTGLVCSPKGIATGWALQYDEKTLTPTRLVKLAEGVALRTSCIRYANGLSVALVGSPFAA